MKDKKYTIEVTETQLNLISLMADTMGRLMIGQLDHSVLRHLEEALHKKHGDFNNGYYEDLDRINALFDEVRRICYNQVRNQTYGVNYNKNADILFDINHVIRHFLYLERGDKSKVTVDAYTPVIKYGSEPFVEVKKIVTNQKLEK